MSYPNKAMEAVCEMLLDDFGLARADVKNLAADLFGEYSALCDNREEADYMQRQRDLMASGGPDDSAYRRDMKAAGRGHLIAE